MLVGMFAVELSITVGMFLAQIPMQPTVVAAAQALLVGINVDIVEITMIVGMLAFQIAMLTLMPIIAVIAIAAIVVAVRRAVTRRITIATIAAITTRADADRKAAARCGGR